ncbi:hypothetical protein F4777DRAFT_584117 [Nemania sp. FL0916]|nr:hypothetical protein F4777DRAFT_584117 [Nemania sp. FL0916]
MSSHTHSFRKHVKRFRERGRDLFGKRGSQTSRDGADEDPGPATRQPSATETSQEPSTSSPAGAENASIYENYASIEEPRPALAESSSTRGIELAGNVDEPEQRPPEPNPLAAQEVEDAPPAPQLPATNPETDDKNPIWSQSVQRFAQEKPKLYELMKDLIGKFEYQSIDDWDTWENGTQDDWTQDESKNKWIRQCKAYLPSFRAVKGSAMAVSNLDPHKVAPLVTAGVFAAVEFFFEMTDPVFRDKALTAMLKAKVLIDKWADSEIDLQGLKGQLFNSEPDQEKITQIEKKLDGLYFECLKLISSIYESGMTRMGRTKSALISGPPEWDRASQKLSNRDSECSQWKTEVEQQVKRREANIAMLNRIRIRSKDPEPGHQSVKERTGVDDPDSIAGKWFLEAGEFISWVWEIQHNKMERRMFWLKGSMGTGKTTLICRIISHFEEQPIVGLRFVPYYCYASGTSKESKAPKHETIIRALCRRLAWNNDGTVAKAAKEFYDKNKDKDEDALFTVKSTWKPLLEALVASSKDTLVFLVDALDECESTEQYRLFLQLLRDLPKTPKGPYFLISSRPHVQVRDYFQDCIQFDALHEDAEQDMTKFIADRIDSKNDGAWAKSIFFHDDRLRSRLERALYRNANGMFRWVEIWLGIFFPKN